MELKVWVEGVPRVVCGLSQETSCQDVVIALAQAIGQTGRYVLIQKLRDKERQLVANERPLESLSKMGQLSSEVQFILRRTGPSSSDGPDQARIPPLIKAPNPEVQKHKEPKKSLTFNLGPSTSPRTPRAAHPSPPPEGQSKETLYQHILRQQGQLQALHTQMEVLEREIHVWERSPPPGLTPDQLQEMDFIEQALRRNDTELAHEQFWEKECQSEMQREKDMLVQKSDLHVALDKHNQTLLDKDSRSEELEQEIQQLVESQREWLKQASERESAVEVKGNLDSQQQHGAQLQMLIEETEMMLRLTDDELQAKTKELDDLNKELRQCNLQQFIQQTGVTPLQSNQQTDEFDFSFLKPDGQSDDDSNYSVLEFNPRTTAKQILGNPRSLQNPLVSSLHPEVVSSTETSWR